MGKSWAEVIDDYVCCRCGGALKLIQPKDELEQPMCPYCSTTHCATTPKVYDLAKEYMKTHSFGYYKGYDGYDVGARKRLNTGKMCEIIGWLLTQPEFKEDDGGDDNDE